jgi:hypothetical protein
MSTGCGRRCKARNFEQSLPRRLVRHSFGNQGRRRKAWRRREDDFNCRRGDSKPLKTELASRKRLFQREKTTLGTVRLPLNLSGSVLPAFVDELKGVTVQVNDLRCVISRIVM